jgi:hypothetical protein
MILPEHVNNTFIVLIPKCKNAKRPRDYRPVSLCNVVMKIVTKTLANRIKAILPDVIDVELWSKVVLCKKAYYR